MNDSYYANKIGLYAYSNGFIRNELKSKRTESEKLKLIAEELSQLDERLQRLKDQQGE